MYCNCDPRLTQNQAKTLGYCEQCSMCLELDEYEETQTIKPQKENTKNETDKS